MPALRSSGREGSKRTPCDWTAYVAAGSQACAGEMIRGSQEWMVVAETRQAAVHRRWYLLCDMLVHIFPSVSHTSSHVSPLRVWCFPGQCGLYLGLSSSVYAVDACLGRLSFFFFKQKTAYEIGQ